MCTAAVSHLVLQDERIQDTMASYGLDFVHQQVVITLYGLELQGQLQAYKEMLPTYLSMDWEKCSKLLETLEKAGLIVRSGDQLTMTHPIAADEAGHSCGMH